MTRRSWSVALLVVAATGCYVQPAGPPPQTGPQPQAYAAQPQPQAYAAQPQPQAYAAQPQPQAYAVQAQPQPQPYAVQAQPQPQAYAVQTTYGNDFVGVHMSQRRQQFASDMVEASPLQRGTLVQGQEQRFQATLQAGKCYRVIGVGDQGLNDLDLYIVDENNNQIAQDTATDNFPVLGLSQPICPRWTGSFYVRALAYSGGGTYGVQLFSTP